MRVITGENRAFSNLATEPSANRSSGAIGSMSRRSSPSPTITRLNGRPGSSSHQDGQLLPLRVNKPSARTRPAGNDLPRRRSGDGCIVSVPDGAAQRTLIIDAGQYSNMHNFLQWRFRYIDFNARFHAAVMTHSDQDHYRGFVPLIKDPKISFDHIYHNGIVERDAARRSLHSRPARKRPLHRPLPGSRQSRGPRLQAREPRQSSISEVYPTMMWALVQDPTRFPDIRMASTEHGDHANGRTYLPGFVPAQARPRSRFSVPFQRTAQGEFALRAFGEKPHDGISMSARPRMATRSSCASHTARSLPCSAATSTGRPRIICCAITARSPTANR